MIYLQGFLRKKKRGWMHCAPPSLAISLDKESTESQGEKLRSNGSYFIRLITDHRIIVTTDENPDDSRYTPTLQPSALHLRVKNL